MTRKFCRARFSFDEGRTFIGWTSGERWNGWGCPYFEKVQADKVLAEWNEMNEACDGQNGAMSFDRARNAYVVDLSAFHVSIIGEKPEDVFEAVTIQTPRGPRKTWAIGAFSACWNENPMRAAGGAK